MSELGGDFPGTAQEGPLEGARRVPGASQNRKLPGEGPWGCRGRPGRCPGRLPGAAVPPGSVAKRAPLIPLGLPLVAKLCIEVCDRAMKKAIEKDSCNRMVEESQEKRAIE